MFPIKLHQKQVAAILLVLVSLVSVGLFFFQENRLTRILLHFPKEKTTFLNGEERSIKLTGQLETDIQRVAQESLLGPVRPTDLRLFPAGGEVTTVLQRGAKVYINLSKEAVVPALDITLGTKEALNVLRKDLNFNFPGLKPIVFTINNQEPNFQGKKEE